ncbi:MAG: hypothetical protein WBB73_05020 [Candidatus Aminicenantaceae bacterium]|jgi:hypothetical protein
MGFLLKNLCASLPQMIFRDSLRFGDQIEITTRNSTYMVFVVNPKSFLVTGGWFERKGLAPARVEIPGCTWGGSAINLDVIAGRGLCIEFQDRAVTSRVLEMKIRRETSLN